MAAQCAAKIGVKNMMPSEFTPRPATKADYSKLASLLSFQQHIHRHLDWRHSLDWLGTQPFWVLEKDGAIVSALACPTDPADVAWIRLFFSTPAVPTREAWEILFEHASAELAGQPNTRFAAVALQPWFANLLDQNGFQLFQEIVILAWENTPIAPVPLPPGVLIRPIDPMDIYTIAEIDARSFESLWINSAEAVDLAYQQSAYTTLAEKDGEILGYQFTTANPFNAHLARLAILPECQGQGIGKALVQDMMLYFQSRRVWQITVNTQSTNQNSLKLYQKTGFRLTGEKYPVYIRHNS